MATIYQVSELAGVSLATVSRVMNKNARVSDKTREKVLAAMKELGYRPNSIAKSLASNCSNSVGILVSELYGPFYGDMMSGIETELRKAEKHVIIAAGHSNEEKEKAGIEFLISRNCDALILHVEAVCDDYLIELSKGSIPVVLINRHIDQLAENCISLDNQLGGYLASKLLLEQGHRDFAYISGPLWKTDAKERLAGHQKALAEYGLKADEQLLFEVDFQEESGCTGMNYLLAQQKPFSALLCANDEMAAGAMATAREHQLDIPAQLSVVGYDNIIFARYLWPKLTTVNYPVKEMGKMAASLILKNIYKKQINTIKNLFEPEIVLRDSSVAINQSL
jgi:LacI family transcriptional regulator